MAGLDEIEQKKYVNEISTLVWDFISTELFELAKEIIPNNQIESLADIGLYQSQPTVIYEYLYVIDRFCNTKVYPQKYNIHFSSKFNRDKLDIEESLNFDLILSIFQSSERESFNSLNKFYPRSSEKYISKPFGIKAKFNVDFSGSIWGLKHLHLKEINRTDKLLYYATIGSNIYIIAIGNHNDMYKRDILEILVNDFPSLLPYLGIGHYYDMPFDNFDNLSADEVERKWKDGENIGFFIKDKFFVSANLMTDSRIKANLSNEINQINYQISRQATGFIKLILSRQNGKCDIKIRLDEYKDMSKNEILIKEENQKFAQFFYISYLKNLFISKELIKTYCK